MYKSYSELGAQPDANRDQYKVFELTDMNQKNQLISQTVVVCVYVYADWCGPCRQIAPDYGSLASKYGSVGKCALVKENIDKKLTRDIEVIPTFNIFLYGKRIAVITGGDIPQVEAKVQQALQAAAGNVEEDFKYPSGNSSGNSSGHLSGHPNMSHNRSNNQNMGGYNAATSSYGSCSYSSSSAEEFKDGPTTFGRNTIRKHSSAMNGQNQNYSPPPSGGNGGNNVKYYN